MTSANAQAAQMLPGEGWFNAGAFPKATFEAQDVIDTGNGAYEAIGTLTIKDIAMPMVLPFTLTIDGDTATASGTAEVLRGDYAIGKDISEATVAGGVKVMFEIVAATK
ncbi:YceI family protein [Breoghania sp. L-A4]|uniref:YceI family protein n=1 Tax=Breoghania sp. L-A4 TaxID=2304600 RepID=UPI0020BFAF5F|nr:YceI family protein [Breoghania sp. L-A4]